MPGQGSDIRRKIRAQQRPAAAFIDRMDQYIERKQAERLASPSYQALNRICRKVLKWTAIIVGGFIALVLMLGIHSAITATPEQKAKWAEERAAREQERERERAARAEREAEELAARQQAEAQEAARRVQLKCLTKLDGSMHELGYEVKQGLREPDSFEHIQSFATPVDGNGFQRVRMKFRARNGFGGINIEMVEAIVRNGDCKLMSWSNLG